MRRCVILLALVASSPASAQEYPKPTPAGEKALGDLIERCVAAGGLKRAEDGKAGAATLAPGDGSKLKAAVEGARADLTPALFDALIVRWREAEGEHEAAVIALLRVAGEVAGDVRAVAFATFFEALRGRDADGGIALLEDAARRFLSCEERAWQAACCNRIGLLFQERAAYARALEAHLKALAIRRAALGERHPDVAQSFNNIAMVYSDQGEHARALEANLKALAIRRAALGERHLKVADSYNNIAADYSDQGEHAKALEAHLKAMEIFRAALGDRHPSVAASYNNIANVFRDQGEHARALEAQLKALEIFRAALGERHPDVAGSYTGIANVYRAQGEHVRALEAYGRALVALDMRSGADEEADASRDATLLTPDPIVPEILLARGRLRELRPGTDPAAGLRAALADYRAAADALERLRDASARDEDKVRRAEDVSELFPHAVGASARLAASGPKAPLVEALDFAERGFARVFLEGLGRSRASAGGRVDPATLADEARMAAEIRQLDARIAREQGKPFEKRDKDAVERLFLDRKRAEEASRALIARMERDHPQYAALKHPRPCSVAEARACLADDEVALTYVLGAEASYLIVLSAREDLAEGGLAVHTLPPAGEIAEAVAALTQARVLEDADATLGRGGAAYRILLAPAAGAIAGKRLVIVPGGVLGRLPFEILAEPGDGGGPRFLVRGHSIRYAPSLTALHLIRRWEGARPTPDRALWALGDPVYTATDPRLAAGGEASAGPIRLAARARGAAFGRLAGSGVEVDRLAGLMGSGAGDRLTGPEATEAAVRRLSADGTLARYRYVHFACHGVLGAGDGVRPGLVLSQVGNAEGEDGTLRADEVTDLRLNADLVALSACQTGQGKQLRAEGVSGLARAFLYAGSRGVLCSLWAVDDASTADLMADVYAGLKSGKSSPEALRAAQLKMIEAGEPPLHWAPFVLIGR